MSYFIPLGGGSEIGASAYFLSLDGINILLDCGARLGGEELYPDYERLLQEITDFANIDLILISHGHYDHIGSFAKIAALATNAEIITTQDTKSLIKLQLLNQGRISGRTESEKVKNERYRLAQASISKIQIQPVMKSFQRKGCKITLIPAGHMIGAVMIYLETENHKVLYSGDYSINSMFGLNGMRLTPDIKPDVLLLNAPNVYMFPQDWQYYMQDKTHMEMDHYSKLEAQIKNHLENGENIYLYSKSIPKHLDLFYFLQNSFPQIPVLLESSSKKLADSFSEMGYDVFSHINLFSSENTEDVPKTPYILLDYPYFVANQQIYKKGYKSVCFDGYSLHASPLETINFVKKLNAEIVFLNHVYPNKNKQSIAGVIKGPRIIQSINNVKYYIKREKKMLYESIFYEELQKKVERALNASDDESKRLKAMSLSAAVYGSLRFSEEHSKKAYELLPKMFKEISYSNYTQALRNQNLLDEDSRKHYLDLVEEGVALLKKALDGDKAATVRYAKFIENLEPVNKKNKKIFFVGRGMVVFLTLLDPDMTKKEYRIIGNFLSARYCDRILHSIKKELLKIHGITMQKQSAKDILQKAEKTISETSAAMDSFNSEDELEKLRFMNDNYKNSLDLIQSQLDEINESIEESAEDAKNTAIESFYSTMNSDEYGNLLDSIEVVNKRLQKLKKDGVKVPPQFLPLTIIFKQLQRFINESGITPIDATGRTFETTMDGLAQFIYIGDSFTNPEETKRVVVTCPGWKFGDRIISLPTVREEYE